jgi:hypothetical protein
MVHQETGGSGTGEPSLTEEVQAQPDTGDNSTGTEAPVLNRAERRAQAKGKKAGANNGVSGLPAHGALGANQRSTGAVVPIRVNRTGSRSK